MSVRLFLFISVTPLAAGIASVGLFDLVLVSMRLLEKLGCNTCTFMVIETENRQTNYTAY